MTTRPATAHDPAAFLSRRPRSRRRRFTTASRRVAATVAARTAAAPPTTSDTPSSGSSSRSAICGRWSSFFSDALDQVERAPSSRARRRRRNTRCASARAMPWKCARSADTVGPSCRLRQRLTNRPSSSLDEGLGLRGLLLALGAVLARLLLQVVDVEQVDVVELARRRIDVARDRDVEQAQRRPRRACRTCAISSSVSTGRCAPVDAMTMSARGERARQVAPVGDRRAEPRRQLLGARARPVDDRQRGAVRAQRARRQLRHLARADDQHVPLARSRRTPGARSRPRPS